MVEILYVVCVYVFFLCKPFSSLVELIEIDANFWKELEEIKHLKRMRLWKSSLL